MPDLRPAPMDHDNPTDWLHAQLEFIDGQLTNYTAVRDRHRTDVVMYERIGAQLPLRYHRAQVEQCTTRIEALLDLRLQVVQQAQDKGGAQ